MLMQVLKGLDSVEKEDLKEKKKRKGMIEGEAKKTKGLVEGRDAQKRKKRKII